MHLPITSAQLFDGPDARENQTVLWAVAGAFAVNGLRTGKDDLLDWQLFLANDFEHLARAKRIYMNKFSDLRHVTPVSRLVKHDVNSVKRSGNYVAIPHVALHEFRVWIHPCRFSPPVRLRLEIIERAYLPACTQKEIDKMRDNQAGATSDQCAFCHVVPFYIRRSPERVPIQQILLQPNARATGLRDDLAQKLFRARREVFPCILA